MSTATGFLGLELRQGGEGQQDAEGDQGAAVPVQPVPGASTTGRTSQTVTLCTDLYIYMYIYTFSTTDLWFLLSTPSANIYKNI